MCFSSFIRPQFHSLVLRHVGISRAAWVTQAWQLHCWSVLFRRQCRTVVCSCEQASRCDTIFIMIFHTVAFLHVQGRNSNFVHVANFVMRILFACFHDTSQMGVGRQSRTATQAWQTIAGEQLCFVSFVGTL